MQDADKIKELSEALAHERQARQEAEAAIDASEQARQEFVSLVTHELRVPMTSIKGYTDLLLKGITGSVNETQTNFLNVIRSNVERMSRMVSDLSDINKIEGDRLQLMLVDVPLQAMLDEAIAAHKAEIQQKEQILRVEVPPDLPQMHCDRSRIVQVLDNMISNATKYTPEGGAITVTAEEAPADEGHYICIVIQDNGIGILENEQSQIFEKFFRASDEETRQTPGNGLALHLSRLLVALHRGRIEFESTRGKGSVFRVILPACAEILQPSQG